MGIVLNWGGGRINTLFIIRNKCKKYLIPSILRSSIGNRVDWKSEMAKHSPAKAFDQVSKSNS